MQIVHVNATALLQLGLGVRQCQIQHRVPFAACSQLIDSDERNVAIGIIPHSSHEYQKGTGRKRGLIVPSQ